MWVLPQFSTMRSAVSSVEVIDESVRPPPLAGARIADEQLITIL